MSKAILIKAKEKEYGDLALEAPVVLGGGVMPHYTKQLQDKTGAFAKGYQTRSSIKNRENVTKQPILLSSDVSAAYGNLLIAEALSSENSPVRYIIS